MRIVNGKRVPEIKKRAKVKKSAKISMFLMLALVVFFSSTSLLVRALLEEKQSSSITQVVTPVEPMAEKAGALDIQPMGVSTTVDINGDIQGAINAAVSGDIITITGSKMNSNSLNLNIPAGVKVVWYADYSDLPTPGAMGVYGLSLTGSGTFELAGGSISDSTSSSSDSSITLISNGVDIIISGGVITPRGNQASPLLFSNCNLTITGGTINSGNNGGIWSGSVYSETNSYSGNVLVTGGTVCEIATANDNVIVTGGTVAGIWSGPRTGKTAHVVVTGGNVGYIVAYDSSGAFDSRGGKADVVYLDGTCNRFSDGMGSAPNNGTIVCASTLNIPKAYNGTNAGLVVKNTQAVRQVRWNTTGAKPVVEFGIIDIGGNFVVQDTIEWGQYLDVIATITGTKVITGVTDSDKLFTFNLVEVDDQGEPVSPAYTDTAMVTGEGTFSFDIDIVDLKAHYYKITEAGIDGEGWTYDKNEAIVWVQYVFDSFGYMVQTNLQSGSLTFTNTYEPVATPTPTPEITPTPESTPTATPEGTPEETTPVSSPTPTSTPILTPQITPTSTPQVSPTPTENISKTEYDGGTVEKEGDKYTAHPKKGYEFHGWYVKDKLISKENPYEYVGDDLIPKFVSTKNLEVIPPKTGDGIGMIFASSFTISIITGYILLAKKKKEEK